jgi:hypothetical protein
LRVNSRSNARLRVRVLGRVEIDIAAITAACLVQLNGGELRVMPCADALVPEDAPDLEHALHAAYHQTLQVQLCKRHSTDQMSLKLTA